MRNVYTCDGGENPAHHQPCTVELIQNDVNQDIFEVWRGSCLDKEFNNYKDAIDYIKSKFDSVIFNFQQIITTLEKNEVIK